MSRTRWMVLVVVLQILFLLLLTASSYAVDAWGTTVRLRTVPWDPHDVLFGDYLQLHYEINEIPVRWLRDAEVSDDVHTLYVVLQKDRSGIGTPVAAFLHKPSGDRGAVILRGIVQYRTKVSRNPSGFPQGPESMTDEEWFHVVYGIEKYFIPQGQGEALLARLQTYPLVDVKVAPWGQVKVAGIE
jgi:uncharacterized membrane-anchored protein